MRLIFIPGFGEDEVIFDNLHPLLSGEKEFLSLWKLCPDQKMPELNVTLLAKDIVHRYNISQHDVVIGHSAGGWVALYIKQLVQCAIVQISSWTDVRKVVKPISNRHLLYRLAKTQLLFNHTVLQWLLKTKYRHQPSAEIFRRIFIRLIEGNRDNRVNQLRLIFNPVKEGIIVNPDLRIHARKDPIVRFPDGPAHEVPGDHFSLYTYPERVAQPIHELLKTLPVS
jgi:acetyl esterase/lipase